MGTVQVRLVPVLSWWCSNAGDGCRCSVDAASNARGSGSKSGPPGWDPRGTSNNAELRLLSSGWILELSITTTRSRQLRRISALVCVFACFLSAPVLAKKTPRKKPEKDEKAAAKEAAEKEKLLQVFVSEPYLELATGPGRGSPCSRRGARGLGGRPPSPHGLVSRFRDERGVEGWARARDMRRTKLADGTPFVFKSRRHGVLTTHNWELGIGGGDYGGANLINAYGGTRSPTNEGRAHAVAVPGHTPRTATRPRPASRT